MPTSLCFCPRLGKDERISLTKDSRANLTGPSHLAKSIPLLWLLPSESRVCRRVFFLSSPPTREKTPASLRCDQERNGDWRSEWPAEIPPPRLGSGADLSVIVASGTNQWRSVVEASLPRRVPPIQRRHWSTPTWSQSHHSELAAATI